MFSNICTAARNYKKLTTINFEIFTKELLLLLLLLILFYNRNTLKFKIEK